MQADIAIVGAGYSGALTAIQLLRLDARGGVRVTLFDPQPLPARGLAYRTWDEGQLLNVPAGNMSALADDPDHFTRYCRGVDPALHAGSFVSRRIYGDYLEDLLGQTARAFPGRLQVVPQEVVGIGPRQDCGRRPVRTASGEERLFDRIVLAMGHSLPRDPLPGLATDAGPAYIANPWDIAALDRCDRSRPILLIGSGHTAIDVLLRIASRGDAGSFLLVSRHGLPPHGHRPRPQAPANAGLPAALEAARRSSRLLPLLRAVRAEARAREASGGDWRDVLNEMRPHLPALWQGLTLQRQRQFLRHVVAFWDVHRHRLAPSVAHRVQQMRDAGQVRILAARLGGVTRTPQGLEVSLRPRGGAPAWTARVGTIVNCTGPTYDLERIGSPLMRQLLGDGLVQRAPTGLGLAVDDTHQVLVGDGHCAGDVFYIGPLLKARFWEAIAVPELRVHARQLAGQLLGSLAPA